MEIQNTTILASTVAGRKDALVQAWLARVLESYAPQTSRFLAQDSDAFRNPIGHTLQQSLAALLDELLGEMNVERVKPLLDGIVRIRAVQDFTASEAVAFVFALKQVVRDEVRSQGQERGEVDDLAVLDARIDELALLAFDLFMRCREQLYEVKANEARRRVSVLERVRERSRERSDPSSR